MKLNTTFRSSDLFRTWFNAATQLAGMSNDALKQQAPKVATFEQQYQNARMRALDMLSVSDKLSQQPNWYLAFEDQGLELIDQGEIHYRSKHLAGHFYAFKKPE